MRITHIKILLIIAFIHLFYIGNAQISLRNFPKDKIMVVGHRGGDWRNAPENSVMSVKMAIDEGVNMAEIDLAMTKDSILVLMHDTTIDRTTTGKGKPADYTLKELKEFYLRDGLGVATEMKIPTLEEIFAVSKGKIFLNLDKGFDYFSSVYPLVQKYGLEDEILYKGVSTYKEFNDKYGKIKNNIVYMPIIRLLRGEGWAQVNDFMNNYKPYGFEFTIGDTEEHLIDFSSLRKEDERIWVNSLWKYHNAGHNDDKALENINNYDWYPQHNVNIIQTDRPQLLIDYLKSKNLYYKLNSK